ncbi:MAG TPA: hypothetical protein VIK59_07595 [Verrucomicrobiae bacterium]
MKDDLPTFTALGKSLQLRKLTFNPKQEFIQNPDKTDWNWPQIFFWTEPLKLMKWIGVVLERISSLDSKVQDDFRQGLIPAQFVEHFPWLAKFTPAQVVEYCGIEQSSQIATDRLIIRAWGDRLCPKSVYSGSGIGEEKADETKFVLNEAAKYKSIRHYQLPQFIFEAAKQNNVRFFIRLGKALQSIKKVPEVDWTRCDALDCLLVDNWCEWLANDRRFPALCFFSDRALADFCSALFGLNAGNPSIDSIRQRRRKLGLIQASRPKVRQVTLNGSEVLFVGS